MTLLLTGVVVLALLLLVGVPIGFALMFVGACGFAAFRGVDAAVEMVSQQSLEFLTNANFVVMPMFVLMGAFMRRAAMADELFDAAKSFLGHRRGGLAMATIAASAGFAAVSHSSLATVTTIAKVATPNMRRNRYDDALIAGSVAAGGTLGVLIPPSGALIVYGLLAQQDLAALFAAGALPAVMAVVFYMFAVMAATALQPAAGPAGMRSSWAERRRLLVPIWSSVVLFLLTMGGIGLGVFTPNEAGGIGAMGALLVALARRRMSWRILIDSLVEAARTASMVFMIVIGALVFSTFVNVSGLTAEAASWLHSLPWSPRVTMVAIVAMHLLLGCLVDGLAMIFLTVPIMVPIVQSLGLNLVWYGILLVMMVEIGQIAPPLGINVYVTRAAMPGVSLRTVFRGIAPFFVADLLRLVVVLLVPGIVLWLPRLLYGK